MMRFWSDLYSPGLWRAGLVLLPSVEKRSGGVRVLPSFPAGGSKDNRSLSLTLELFIRSVLAHLDFLCCCYCYCQSHQSISVFNELPYLSGEPSFIHGYCTAQICP